jgi:putative colanic acid biosynthesis UDP-glucose lipid carrier transferase
MSNILRLIFFIGDLILLNVSIFLSYSLGSTGVAGVEKVNGIYLLIFSNLTWFFLIIVSNPYSMARDWGVKKTLRNQLTYIFFHLLVVTFLTLFFKKSYAPIQVGLMYLLFTPSFFIWKIVVLYVVATFTEGKVKVRNMIIVGEGELVREVRRYFLIHTNLKYRYLGTFKGTSRELPLTEITAFCSQKQVHEILCCVPDILATEYKKLINFGLNQFIQVKLVTNFRRNSSNEFSLEKGSQVPVLDLAVVPLDEIRNRIIKRCFDIVFSFLVIMLVLSWLVPLLGVLIKLDSKGPVYFRQKRGGLNNKPFDCLKFRTMVVNFEADEKQATKGDPRITKIGRFLRKSSLDEFPQFLNVFWGDMSIIGPRPHPLKLNEEFSLKIEGLMARHYVKPGLTGLAQSMGYRGETKNIIDMENRIAMDRFYIENWSMFLDIKIIFRTVISLIKGSENAY